MIADRVEAATQPTSAEPSDSPLSDAPVHSRIPLDMPDEPLTGAELNRIQQLRRVIDEYYEKIPIVLRHEHESQEVCLDYLLAAERSLTPPVDRSGIIRGRLNVTRVEIEIGRARSSNFSFTIVVAIVYMFALAVGAAMYFNVLEVGVEGKQLNERLIFGIPLPIMVWSVVGSFTSMLFRAGQLPFSNPQEALRWLLFRPVVGIVMGLLTYLMVTAGLIVFAGTSKAQTPELLWVIAFVGSFSDSLSVNLLQKIVGKFQAAEAGSANPSASEKVGTPHSRQETGPPTQSPSAS